MLKLRKTTLDWALNHALTRGDTYMFPRAFEFEAIALHWEGIRDWIIAKDILSWVVRPLRRCLSPKQQYGFRIVTQLDPLDFLVFAGLIYEIGQDLEGRRLSRDEETVFSHRFAPASDGTLFDDSVNYSHFQARSAELADGDYTHVVTADIADFFPRLYSHRVENALRSATRKENHAIALSRLMRHWNEGMSYGIPVGPVPSRLIAEVAIDDVDKALRSESATFVRFSDDYRIFCKSSLEAYQRLAGLANTLFENHGLTLNQEKTRILTIEQFTERYLTGGKDTELLSLSEKFQDILEGLGLESYEDIEYDDLDPETQNEIDSLNLQELFYEQLEMEQIDIPTTRFILRRLAQLGNDDCVEMALTNIESLYPVFTDVIMYLGQLRHTTPETRKCIGAKALSLLKDSLVSHLEYHRLWLLSLFASDTGWDNEDRFFDLFVKFGDHFSQRKIVLALGRANQDQWFRTRKRNSFDFAPWVLRAFLAAGSCLPNDERRHWYDSLEPRLDPLEFAVTKWARQHPFGTA